MALQKTFKVNEYISLKLINGNTVIFIANKEFLLCKKLTLSIPSDSLHLYNKIDSIDEASELYNHFWSKDSVHREENGFLESPEHENTRISPEIEFWGHCSNLQIWHENEYDTRLIHSNLAFPLLKKLTETGDSLAKRVFKEEIAKRLQKGTPTVTEMILRQGYLKYLDDKELETLDDVLRPLRESCIEKIRSEANFKYLEDLVLNYSGNYDEREDVMEYWQALLSDEEKGKLQWIKSVDIPKPSYYYAFASSIARADWVTPFELKIRALIKSGEFGVLTQEDIFGLPELKTVKSIVLGRCRLQVLPENIGYFTSAEELLLSFNLLTELPRSIRKLKSLKALNLNNNQLTSIPRWVLDLPSLEWIGIHHNPLDDETIEFLKKAGKNYNISFD